MRTLNKPAKQKNNPSPTPQKNETDKKTNKPQSKKVLKTIFHSPFRYKMYTNTYLVNLYHTKLASK